MSSRRTCLAVVTAGLVLSVGAEWSLGAPPAAAEDTDPAVPVTEEPTQASTGAVPDAPAALSVMETDGSLLVEWSAPVSDGGDPIVRYDVSAVPTDAGGAAPPVTPIEDGPLSTVVSSLTNGVDYEVTVTASNEMGAGLPATATGTPRTVPGAPSIGAVRAGDATATVRWQPPADDGGAALRGFRVKAAPSGIVTWVGAAATSAKVSGLPNGDATTFTVAAINAAGKGQPSTVSEAVTPRMAARIVVRRQPSAHVAHGQRSTVRSALVTAGGVGVPAQRVNLLAKVRPSTRWRQVDSGLTGDDGTVTLRTTLRAIARLRLQHPAGIVAARSVDPRSVVIANRVAVASRSNRTRVGKPVVIRGTVGPRQKVGSPVRLQRRVSGEWEAITSGRMVTRQRYVIRWNPQKIGSYKLRVAGPRSTVRAPGSSAVWKHHVDPENAADIATDILRDGDITLATVHLSAGRDGATAQDNIVDVANGRLARRSCYGGAPCGSTALDLRVLRAIREMGTRGTITVSEIAGGVHAGSSAHYSGRAVDITWVNGHHVGYGTSYGMVTDVCRAFGANQIFTPSNDPWGGHSRHVHCGWG